MTADVAGTKAAPSGRLLPWLFVAVGAAAAVVAYVTIVRRVGGNAQPWDSELSDNFVFAQTVWFTLALGVAVGYLRGARVSARSPKLLSRGTVIGYWVLALGLLLSLPTGMWQYLGGILDVSLPLPLYLIYRVHYIGATLVIFSFAHFAAYWWVGGGRGLWIPRAHWAAHARGFVDELPPRLAGPIARLLRVDRRTVAGDPGAFTFYEKFFSFPAWSAALILITVTGLIKAARYAFEVPGGVLYWASTLHVAAMVMIGILLLDHLRYTFGRRGATLVAAITGFLVALAGLAVSYEFIANAFVAKTAAKEGIVAQLALLFGGLLFAFFAIALLRASVRLVHGDRPGTARPAGR